MKPIPTKASIEAKILRFANATTKLRMGNKLRNYVEGEPNLRFFEQLVDTALRAEAEKQAAAEGKEASNGKKS